jgi:hypothetical protein
VPVGVRSVGVMSDSRSYDFVCALRAVTSTDGMTADYFPFPHEFLVRTATCIINEVRGINRVVYNVTSKPPAQSSGNDSKRPRPFENFWEAHAVSPTAARSRAAMSILLICIIACIARWARPRS